MALIKCTECGHEVSDRASMCPNCGCPIESLGATQEELMDEEPKKKKGWIWALIVVLLCLIGGGGYYAYTHLVNKNNAEDIVELTPDFIKAIEKYDQLGIFSEGYAAVCKDGKWGYINTKGEEVIPCNIDASCVGPFSEGLAFVDNNEIVGDEPIFSVIDYNGNVIFKGKNYSNESTIFESHDMPYFIKGKIYVPTLDSKQDVYDKQGNKLETISWEEADSILSRYVNCSQECFFEDTNCIGEGEKRLFRRKWGVKDSVGKVLISAKYDKIATTHHRTNILRPLISNGVILVVLEEPEEGHYTDGGVYDPSIRHYGYVDLKGNDTFSEELKARCLKAETKAMDNCKRYLASFEQQQWDNTESYSDEYSQTSYNNEGIVNNSTTSNSNSINNELAEYDRTIETTMPIMEQAYQQFLRDVRSGRYTTITPPSSYYELSNACTNVGAAAKQAQRLCERNGNMGDAQRYERIWEHERQLYNSAYNILGNLH